MPHHLLCRCHHSGAGTNALLQMPGQVPSGCEQLVGHLSAGVGVGLGPPAFGGRRNRHTDRRVHRRGGRRRRWYYARHRGRDQLGFLEFVRVRRGAEREVTARARIRRLILDDGIRYLYFRIIVPWRRSRIELFQHDRLTQIWGGDGSRNAAVTHARDHLARVNGRGNLSPSDTRLEQQRR